MSQRTLRKPTRWSKAEWAHVAGQARSAGIPALRYVREAALGIRRPAKFVHRGASITVDRVRPSPDGDVVVELARLLATLRTLEALPSSGNDLSPTSPAALAKAVETAIAAAPNATPARLAALCWTVLPYGEALASIVRTMVARGTAPPPHVVRSLLESLRSGLHAA